MMVGLLNKMHFPDFHNIMLEPLIEVTNCLEGLRMNTELYDVINLTSALCIEISTRPGHA